VLKSTDQTRIDDSLLLGGAGYWPAVAMGETGDFVVAWTDERVYIGGEIQIYHLTTSGFSVYTIDRFNNYDSDEQAIYANFHSNQNDT